MYQKVYERSITDPEGFWGEAATAIDWTRPPTRVLDRSREPFFRWYPDGELNTCHNAVDRHVAAGRGDQPALIYDSPVTGTVRTYTYRELRDEVARCAGALRRLGVDRGDRVVLYLPMVPEAVIAMLACARLGAVHSVVFGGFAAHELAVRIDDAKPVVVVSASCGIEPTRVVRYKPLLDAAIEESAHKPRSCLILQRPQHPAELMPGRDVDWAEAVGAADPVDCVPVAATDPLYILYTSGTTGRPKGVVRDNGGHAVALRWSMANIFDTAPGEVYWAASDVGWVVGHSYIVYAPLLTGATTVLYEGKPVGTPDSGAFWRVVDQHRVTTMFTAPTALRAIKKEDPDGTLIGARDLGSLRHLFLAGERLDPETYHWAGEKLGVPVIDNWWQTETGWPIAANLRGLDPMPTRPGSPSVPVPGYDVRVVDPAGDDVPAGTDGAIVIRLPLPPGCLPTLWGDDDWFVASYLVPGQLPHRRRWPLRRRRLPVRDGAHRRRDQRVRAPAVDRRDGGGAGRAPGGRRVRGDRGGRRPEGPGTARLRGAQGGCRGGPAGARRRTGRDGPRADRPGRRAARGGRGAGAAEDPVRQDPASHDARDRRRPGGAGAVHDRRCGRPRHAAPDPPPLTSPI
jgi:propionyl-CoA synthetase